MFINIKKFPHIAAQTIIKSQEPINKFFSKMFSNKLEISKYYQEEWFKILTACQDEISETEQNYDYTNTYRYDEVFYWTQIARWIYEISKTSNDISSVLDIGAGYGTLSLYTHKLFGGHNTCIDFTDKYFSKFLINKYGFNFKTINIETDQLLGKYNMIIMTEVIEHFNYNALSTLQKIKKRLNPGGVLLLSTPDATEWGKITKYYSEYKDLPKYNPHDSLPIIDDHVWQFDPEMLIRLIAQSGFNIIKCHYSLGVVNKHINIMCQSKVNQAEP